MSNHPSFVNQDPETANNTPRPGMDIFRPSTTRITELNDSTPTSVSVESLSTAYTSNDTIAAAMSAPSLPLPLPHPLRKSSSVGPFPRSHGVTRQTAAPPPNDTPTVGLGRDSIYDQDFEVESRVFQMPRRKQSLPGQLPLPSRSGPSINAASRADNSPSNTMNKTSMSSTTRQMTTSLDSQKAPNLNAHTSAKSKTLERNSSVGSNRTRSRSVGMNVSSPTSHLPFGIKTDISTFEPGIQSTGPSTVNLLVLGSPGCGKASAINKGCKAFRLGKASDVTCAEGERSVHYQLRTGVIRVATNEHPDAINERTLNVMRLDVDEPFMKNMFWPASAPKLHGVVVCYDAANQSSFAPVEFALMHFGADPIPTVVLACKSDLEKQVNPQRALDDIIKYDVGLVEVVITSDEGKKKLQRAFEWILRSILKLDKPTNNPDTSRHRNPASPSLVMSRSPWSDTAGQTPSAETPPSSAVDIHKERSGSISAMPALAPIPQSPLTATAPSDSQIEDPTSNIQQNNAPSATDEALLQPPPESEDTANSSTRDEDNINDVSDIKGSSARESDSLSLNDRSLQDKDSSLGDKGREFRAAQWVSWEDLVDKFLFLGVSGDDPAFISRFLLTYRRFAIPRQVLVSIQTRLRQLDDSPGDPMLACYAQMRMCALLKVWIETHPSDFAVRGTSDALNAVVKFVLSKTYLLQYGCDFIPFLELLPSLVDQDSDWAIQPDNTSHDSDDEDDGHDLNGRIDDTPDQEELSINLQSSIQGHRTSMAASTVLSQPSSTPTVTANRDRKLSLPLTKASAVNVPSPVNSNISNDSSTAVKQMLRDLQKYALQLEPLNPDDVAREITNSELKHFLQIEPRHWMRYAINGKGDSKRDSIVRYNEISQRLATWVVSIILCHDKPRARAQQILKLIQIAEKLRGLNNYSALRAFVAGINNATYPGDPSMEYVKNKSPEAFKLMGSWGLLLQQRGGHKNYRLALKNSKGICIPALEIHMFDIIRTHEGNVDFDPDDNTKIHWGKFNLLGNFVMLITAFQYQCRSTWEQTDMGPERPYIRNLVFPSPSMLMDEAMQQSRIDALSPLEDTSNPNQLSQTLSSNVGRSNGLGGLKEASRIKKYFKL